MKVWTWTNPNHIPIGTGFTIPAEEGSAHSGPSVIWTRTGPTDWQVDTPVETGFCYSGDVGDPDDLFFEVHEFHEYSALFANDSTNPVSITEA